MALFIKYHPGKYSKMQFGQDLERIKSAGYDGLFFPVSVLKSSLKQKEKAVDYQLQSIITHAKSLNLKTGVILNCFNDPALYRNDNFTPPGTNLGASYVPESEYYPICINNPTGLQSFHQTINKVTGKIVPDYLYLKHFRFPFYWEKEELDIQSHIPPFCYCPFCITEFSSVVGEIVSTGDQIQQMMPEWLEWRTEVLFNLLLDVIENVAGRSQLIIALPPLSLIDLPFTTGQLPQLFIEEGCFVSPQLHHKIKGKNLAWVEDLLDQYQLDLRSNRLFPSFEYSNEKEFEKLANLSGKFPGIILRRLSE
ncbi:MAG: hypothetical protein J7L86_06955 [Candidatus Marinimicrobia bacterium]|nr:hypothetical protein [Candidatus Neomarinimicrobiota bacterium]